eukprot:TRINITY_DN507_c0_g1_i1.p1 TRINITY_DN507_c0_g1~~TRINITY_DN507_c0_g1_i1.p1  ORF type:complete len:156 (-),score=30.77 TRINITY_DN507_c0_g1_i1:687-1154(-)
MSSKSESKVVVPRNFRLLAELEEGEKGTTKEDKQEHKAAPWISYGLDGEKEDILLSYWNCTIIGPQNTNLGEYLFNLKVTCGKDYPDKPPSVRFIDKINMDCVDSYGNVTSKLPVLANWKRDYKIKNILYELWEHMIPAAKLKQPSQGSTYSSFS